MTTQSTQNTNDEIQTLLIGSVLKLIHSAYKHRPPATVDEVLADLDILFSNVYLNVVSTVAKEFAPDPDLISYLKTRTEYTQQLLSICADKAYDPDDIANAIKILDAPDELH